MPLSSLSPRRSIVAQLTLFVAVLLAVLVAALVTAGYRLGRATLARRIDAQLSSVAGSRRETVRAEIRLLQQRAELNTTRGDFRGHLNNVALGRSDERTSGFAKATVKQIADGEPILTARLVDRTGFVHFASDPEDVGRSLADEPVFLAGLEAVELGIPREVEGRFEVLIAAPVRGYGAKQEITGALVLTVDVTSLAKAVRDTTGLGRTGEVLLGVRDGEHIRYVFPPRRNPNEMRVPLASMPTMAAALAGRETVGVTHDSLGEVLAAGLPVGEGGWALVAKMDTHEAYAPIARGLRTALMLGGGVSVIGLVAAYLLTLRFTRPIRRLTAAAEAVASGDIGTTVPVRSANELGRLSTAFNEMTTALAADQAALSASETRLRLIIDLVPHLIFAKDADGRFVLCNRAIAESVGLTPEEMIGRTVAELLPDKAQCEAFRRDDLEVLASGQPKFIAEEARTDGLGRTRFLQTIKIPFTTPGAGGPAVLGVAVDITEHKRALAQSEVLLREVHHRVKNNMQVISSLLRIHAAKLREPEQRGVFEDCRERIGAMALIHERLYASGQFAFIEFGGYLTEMVRMILSSSAVVGAKVQLDLQLEAVEVSVDVAVPLGLIASELVINALKHAFAGERGGVLRVKLRAGDPMHELTVRDDGPGFSPASAGSGIGLELLESLTRQIRGERTLESTPDGVIATVRWPAQRPG